MEIFGIVVFIVLVTTIAGTVSALLRDGRGHTPQVTSERPWGTPDAPSTAYWSPRIY